MRGPVGRRMSAARSRRPRLPPFPSPAPPRHRRNRSPARSPLLPDRPDGCVRPPARTISHQVRPPRVSLSASGRRARPRQRRVTPTRPDESVHTDSKRRKIHLPYGMIFGVWNILLRRRTAHMYISDCRSVLGPALWSKRECRTSPGNSRKRRSRSPIHPENSLFSGNLEPQALFTLYLRMQPSIWPGGRNPPICGKKERYSPLTCVSAHVPNTENHSSG